MGEKEKGQGGGGGRQSRQAPQRIPERHSHPATTRASSPQGATVARSASAARVQPRGCKGRSPLHKITLSPPLSAGKSALRARVGGISFPFGEGGRKEREGSVSRRQSRQALPFGTAVAGRAGNQPDKPPARVPVRQGQPVPLGFSPGDARGGSPLHKNNLDLPLPAGKGVGGWGLGNNLKAGSAGGKESMPPA